MSLARHAVFIVTIASVALSGAAPPKASAPTAAKAKASKAEEPITLEFGNMKSEKPKLLSLAKHMKENSGGNGSASYATQFAEMAQLVRRIGAANLSTEEAELIMSVPEPTADATAQYRKGKLDAQESVAQKINETDQAVAKWRQQKLEEAKLAEEQRQADEARRVEQEKADAMNRQANAQEKMARAQQQQAAINARLFGY